ncbi:MAG: bifunctional demethylmenaquinone methyltransferase/2-methoxy-6-polyprenyl-1,4-benzoquinol methylase UbiE [Bacteroidales bacterium]|nr:bifunctional demethylmenaquinone methyltransferase/2-methoxy-6-polyprenyl-1,4-benzoquinol methylase UbiE [Bacteroidales bacterium]MCM1147429.1 bifunctional demethylmenaquinone methyltransferase/2-methoxy-6-polyprenyl-1,4-benzoquinol methylase UbiE [Bacteroidales bacterium]MCM1206098.1 bifunctional demethylmenaquinone methyltransferase/2-methoxy-6-polyprenyl-1,4-benzoquinol methylase UbiE [Bacillota bacterium]MCM1510071.1 bifunctional demethylmenaquinone methyltransferase/2-methoxy-6-polypreny
MLKEKKDIGIFFDGIAGTYDMLNHILSLNIDKKWRCKTIQQLSSVSNLLDVAIGTADLAIEAMRQQKATYIQGLDLSCEMMRIGKEKVDKAGLTNRIGFDYGSALDMPYENNTFDALTCAYGVRNFSDIDKGLSEFFRVLKPGSQLVILELSYPENRIIRAVYDLFFTYVLPFIGCIFSHNKSAYIYLNRSVKEFICGEEMVSRMQNAGFKKVTFKPLTFGITTIYTAVK